MPHDPSQIVEGGGLRCWGLAKTLSKCGFEVSLAVPDSYLPKIIHISENLVATPYSSISDLITEIQKATVVIYPAGAPHLSNLCIENRDSSTILIADAYVPIHVEVASRQFPGEVAREESAYNLVSPNWLRAITDADILLCASLEQRAYYLGILSASGRLTPSTYNHLKLLVIPFGYFPTQESENSENLSHGEDHGKVIQILWYGGFYPWFNTAKFADVLADLDKKISSNVDLDYRVKVVGAENPFVEDPNFKSHSKLQIRNLEANSKISFSPWLPYGQRRDAFSDIDIVVCLTADGYENDLAWRTRYLDFIEFSVPLLTNSKDPLARKIVEAGAGWHFDSTNIDSLSTKIFEVMNNHENIDEARIKYSELQRSLTWDNAIIPLVGALNLETSDILWQKNNDILLERGENLNAYLKPPLKTLIKLGIQHYKSAGLRSTLKRTRSFISNSVESKKIPLSSTISRVVVFIHQLDNSGSPLIAHDIVSTIANKTQELRIDKIMVYSFGEVDRKLESKLLDLGINIERLERNQIPTLSSKDLVIVNGLAQSKNLIYSLLSLALTSEKLPIFLVHEDMPQVHQDDETLLRIGKALNSGQIRIVAPSLGTTKRLQEAIKSDLVETRPYSISNYPKSASNFEKSLNIHLTGSTHDFRKNQQFALILLSLVHNRVKHNLERYRKIDLTLIGIDESTRYGRLLIELAKPMSDFVTLHGSLSKDQAIAIMEKCNAVMCVSEYEALPLFVSESMAMGHVVLRNNCSGVDEQLLPGENGVLLNLSDMQSAVESVLSILDREVTSDLDLEKMSNVSRKMVEPMIFGSSLDYLGLPQNDE